MGCYQVYHVKQLNMIHRLGGYMDKKDIIIYILMVLLTITIGIIGYLLGKIDTENKYNGIPIYSEILNLNNESTSNITNEIK